MIKRNTYSNTKRKEVFKKFTNTCEFALFDITACECTDFSKCDCPPSNRIPSLMQDFIVDQRKFRQMSFFDVEAQAFYLDEIKKVRIVP